MVCICKKKPLEEGKYFFVIFYIFCFVFLLFPTLFPLLRKEKEYTKKKCFIVRDESQKRRRTKKNNNKKLWLREALAFATGVTEMLSVMIHSTVNWYN